MKPLCPRPHRKKPMKTPMKGTRGISWGPLLTPGPRAVPERSNGQFAPATLTGDSMKKKNIYIYIFFCLIFFIFNFLLHFFLFFLRFFFIFYYDQNSTMLP
ncbi:unnamed protein product [Staurois parvus]|uniref:Uncharacterized protein n=1 Tax=Staurois parvus TaxID=386267 RepID=A0ABN9DPM8_9NEOB|nr:unnamed protein product [Staurois parvus]